MTQPKQRQPADQAARTQATNDLDTSLLIEAAAGTGKTTLLVNRVLALLRADKAQVSQIAAITFTEKAAGELKMRLRQGMEESLRESDGAPPAAMLQALSELESMSVSTIHRFCAELIRERPVEAGVDPKFTICDELEQKLILSEAWDDWIATQMSADNIPLRRAIERGIAIEESPAGGSSLSSLAALLIEHRDLAGKVSIPLKCETAKLQGLASCICSQIAELAISRSASCPNGIEDAGAKQIAKLEIWSAQFDTDEFDDIVRWLRDAPPIRVNSGNQKNWSPESALKDVKAQFAELKALAEELQTEVTHSILFDLAEIIQPFVAYYEERKQQRRVLDFTDLLVVARDMLAGNKPARDHFKRRFKYLLVDEFQDTDPLQAEVVFYISEKVDQHAETWDEVDLEPGRLFIVGDPKQSIYRFRRADLDLYGRVKEIFMQQGGVLQLSVNFRSVPGLLHEANAIFEPIMTGPTETRFEPEHVPLIPFRAPSSTGAAVELLPPPADMEIDALKAADWRRKESGCIAAYIKQAVSSKISLQRKNGDRPVTYGDIAILYRYTTGLESLEDALRAHDVPYQVSGGKHYYTRMEFQNLLCVLRALENPFDAANVVGALRSPFFGHSDEEILAHWLSAKSLNYLHSPPSQGSELHDAFEILKDLHQQRTQIPAASLITNLFERTQALQICALKPHGNQRVANLLKVRDMVQSLSESGVSSFGGIVRRLAQLESGGRGESESPVAEYGENVVQLVTFHKAKGLEFPMVILAYLGQRETNRETHVLDRATHHLSLNFGTGKNTRDWDSAFAIEKDRSQHEMIRLFYVAMTRAKDRLVIPAYWWDKPDKGFLGYLNNRYPPDDNHVPSPEGANVRVVDTHVFDIDKRSLDRFRARPQISDILPDEAKQFWLHRREWRVSMQERATQLNNALTVVTATNEMRKADTTHSGTSEPSQGESRATVFGTFVHRILELVDFDATKEVVVGLAITEERNYGLSNEDAQLAADMVYRALQHPLIRDHALAASVMYREVPFSAICDGELHEGFIDLIYIENGEAVIVDYKTNNVTSEEAVAEAEKYQPQANVYARAMSAVLDMPVRRVKFFFLRPGVSVDIPPSAHAD